MTSNVLDYGYLRVVVVGGKSVGGKENFENVYCSLALCDINSMVVKRTAQKTKRNKRNQPWNETFDFILDPSATGLILKARSKGVTLTHKIGRTIIPLEKLTAETETEMWLTLFDKHKSEAGQIQIRYTHFKKMGHSASATNSAHASLNRPPLQFTYSKREINREERRSKKLAKLFSMPQNERVLYKFECSLEAHTGVLYVTEHYLFFVSKHKRFSIRFADTETIEVRTPNSLRVSDHKKQEYLFTNFRRVDRVAENVKQTRESALLDDTNVPIAEAASIPADESVTEEIVSETEAESSEMDTTDDEGFVRPSPQKMSGTLDRSGNLDGVNPQIAAEVNKMMELIEARRAGQNTVASTTIVQPVVTGISVVQPVYPVQPVQNKRSSIETGYLPNDEDKELNLSPKPELIRNVAPLAVKEISTTTPPVLSPHLPHTAPVVAPTKVAPSLISASEPFLSPSRERRGVHGEIHTVKRTVPPKSRAMLKTKLSGLQQQIFLIPLLSSVCFIMFAFISNWCGVFCGVLAATLMGTLMAILQPGKVSNLASDFLINQMGQKKLAEPSISWAVQAGLAGLVCLPLQLVSTGFAGIRLGWFGALLSTFVIGTASSLLEVQFGLGGDSVEVKKTA